MALRPGASCSHARGLADEAEALAREALEILAPTDAVLFNYGALLDLGEVLRPRGRDDDRAPALAEALTLA